MDRAKRKKDGVNRIQVSGIQMAWHPEKGTCTFEDLPVAMMWVDTTLAGLMSGMQSMVGTNRFALALQSEGRKSVEADWLRELDEKYGEEEVAVLPVKEEYNPVRDHLF